MKATFQKLCATKYKSLKRYGKVGVFCIPVEKYYNGDRLELLKGGIDMFCPGIFCGKCSENIAFRNVLKFSLQCSVTVGDRKGI